jgi:CRP-like cAMP-binding protein
MKNAPRSPLSLQSSASGGGKRFMGKAIVPDAVFNIIAGMAKSCRSLPGEGRHIVSFLFPDDLIGLAEGGRYVNSTEAITAVSGYRIPVTALEARLRKDSALEFEVICKLCHELREAQRHAFSRNRALSKIGLFLQMLESYQEARGEGAGQVYLPMSRSHIGDYVGLSPEAVSRSFRALASRGVIVFRDRRHVKIADRARFVDITSASEPPEVRPRLTAA